MKNEADTDKNAGLPEMSLFNVSRRGFLGGSATVASAALVGVASAVTGQQAIAQSTALQPPPAPNASGGMGVRLTYLGGPTYLIEIGNFRIVSDPGFDPQGTERNEGPGHLLTKIMAPPIAADDIGELDLVLLSHAQHIDNLDNEGKRVLGTAKLALTTPASAAMGLPGNPKGLETWESIEVTNAHGEKLKVTAMPAVHTSNPDLRPIVGEVTGFMVEWEGQKDGALYLSGDSVWIEEMNDIAKRYKVGTAILHMGAANIPAVGDNILTMRSEDGARLSKLLNLKNAYPAHFEGWRHFSEGSWKMLRDFNAAGVADTLRLLKPGEWHEVEV
jgi:L-ascorbate metabolism protein UlaG (beta-lactamase superfamily)